MPRCRGARASPRPRLQTPSDPASRQHHGACVDPSPILRVFVDELSRLIADWDFRDEMLIESRPGGESSATRRSGSIGCALYTSEILPCAPPPSRFTLYPYFALSSPDLLE